MAQAMHRTKPPGHQGAVVWREGNQSAAMVKVVRLGDRRLHKKVRRRISRRDQHTRIPATVMTGARGEEMHSCRSLEHMLPLRV